MIRECVVLLASLSAILTAFYWPCLSGGADFYLSDISYYFHPFCQFIGKCWRESGGPPLWNPYMYCGMSQAAVPSPGIFYPPGWLLFGLPFSCGLALYLLFHQLVAAAGGWCFAKKCGLPWPAATVLAIICSMSGYMFGLSSNFTLMASAAWIPLALTAMLMITGSDRRNAAKWTGATALCVGLLLAAGRPEVAAPGLALLVLCAWYPLLEVAFRQLSRNTRADVQPAGGRSTLMPAALEIALWRSSSIVFGLALAAPVILPAIEWTVNSPRARGMQLRYVFTWSANWFDFAGLILNNPVGDLLDLSNTFRNMVVSRPGYLPFLSSLYIGPAAIALAIIGILDKSWHRRKLVLYLLVIFCIMAAGDYTPVAPAVAKISPFFAAFRYPVKLMIFPIFLLGICSAYGFTAICQRRVSRQVTYSLAASFTAAVLAGMIMVFSPQLADIFVPSESTAAMRQAQVLFGASIIQSGAVALAFCSIVIAFQHNLLPYGATTVLCVSLVAIPPVISAYQFHRHWAQTVSAADGTKESFLSQESVIAGDIDDKSVRSHGRFLTLYFDPLMVPPWYKVHRAWLGDEKFYHYARQLLLPNTHLSYGLRHANGYEAAETRDYKELFSRAYLQCSQNPRKHEAQDLPLYRFCRITGTRLVLTQVFGQGKTGEGKPLGVPELDRRLFRTHKDNQRLNVRRYQIAEAYPRAFLARHILERNTQAECLHALSDPAEIELDKLSGAVLMSRSDIERLSVDLRKQLLYNGAPSTVSPTHAKSDVEIIGDTTDRVQLHAKTDAPALLVLCDQMYPGWKAYLDEQSVPIVRANLFCRAIELGSGEHSIRFAYEPESVTYGLLACGGAMVAVIALLAGGLRRIRPADYSAHQRRLWWHL